MNEEQSERLRVFAEQVELNLQEMNWEYNFLGAIGILSVLKQDDKVPFPIRKAIFDFSRYLTLHYRDDDGVMEIWVDNLKIHEYHTMPTDGSTR